MGRQMFTKHSVFPFDSERLSQKIIRHSVFPFLYSMRVDPHFAAPPFAGNGMQKNVGLFSSNSVARERCIYKKYLWNKGCMFITNWVQRTRKMSNKLRFNISDPEDDFELFHLI
jgi:hypothetical protein